MAHVLELATTGRAKCRGCGRAIAKGALRFGEVIPNPFAEGAETTLWFHPRCAAYKRPEALLQALEAAPGDVPERETLAEAARVGLAHRRLPRIDGAERAPSGQAKCRHCKQPIERGSWRIRLVFFEDGRFTPGGNVHVACRREYFDREDVLDRLLCFMPEVAPEERGELERALAGG